MTASELKRLMYATGYEGDPKAFAKALGVDARTVERWLKGETQVSRRNRQLLALMKPRGPAFASRFQAYLEALEAEGLAHLATLAPAPSPAAPSSPAAPATVDSNPAPVASPPVPATFSSGSVPVALPEPNAQPARWHQRRAVRRLALGGVGLAGAGIVLQLLCAHAPVPTPEPTPTPANRSEPIESPKMIPFGKDGEAPNPGTIAGAPAGKPLPDKPLEGQELAPCSSPLDKAINGACWVGPFKDVHAPCPKDSYEYKGECYLGRMAAPKTPSSTTPRKAGGK